jgi:hypothetical protein
VFARAGRQNPTYSVPRPGVSIIFTSTLKTYQDFLPQTENYQKYVAASGILAEHVP